MSNSDAPSSPLDAVAGLTGRGVTDAFKLLGNETRLAILVALWEAKTPSPRPAKSPEPSLSFSELHDRVGVRDSGQFNYHLNKLVDRFVEQTEEGYRLTQAAQRVLSAVLAGTLTDAPSFDSEPTGETCYLCGAPTVVDYAEGTLVTRCTSCEGAFQHPNVSGVIGTIERLPAGLANRTPQEFHQHGKIRDYHAWTSLLEGICIDCSGTVSGAIHVCDAHDTRDGTICAQCGSAFEMLSHFVCDICKSQILAPAWWAPVFTDAAVKTFFRDHGLDPKTLYLDGDTVSILQETIAEMDVTGTDPLRVTITIEIDDEPLAISLDAAARVIDVTEPPA